MRIIYSRRLAFEHRRMPWLQTLDPKPPLRLSLLGLKSRSSSRAAKR
jgi:hypothetical protein